MSQPAQQVAATTQNVAPVIHVYHQQAESPPSHVSPYLQYGGPYVAGLAAVIAATLAAKVAWKGITAARENLVHQMNEQRRISARVSRASVVSANRQKWIDALRDDLASFLTADFALLDETKIDVEGLSEQEASRLDDRIRDAKQTRRLMQRRIQLRLNPDKPHHQALYKDVRALMPASGDEHRTIRVRLIKSAQAFLREEWLRVKAEAGEWEDAVTSEAEPAILASASAANEATWVGRVKSFGRRLIGRIS